MGLPISVVDAFTDRPFGGNPAAVCVLPEPRNPHWMQKVAQEMNLSETAFLHRQADGFQLRWFTPTVEVDLCGHATLASAHALWEAGHLKSEQTAHFYTRSGRLAAQRNGEWIELDFPAQAPEKTSAPAELLAALGVTAKYIARAASITSSRLKMSRQSARCGRIFEPWPSWRLVESSSPARPLPPPMTSCLGFSPRRSESPKIPLLARLIAVLVPTGKRAWERPNCWLTRPRHVGV
jgi:hypothetical protein